MKLISSIILVVVILLTSLNIVDLPWELRFADAKNNYFVVMLLAISLPLSAFLFSLCRETKSIRTTGLFISVFLVFPCFIVAMFANWDYERIKAEGVDYSFEEINRLKFNNSNYVLYRTNGGATTSYGLVLRLEKKLGFGLNLVNVIYSKYKASESTLEFIDNNQIKMQIQPYDKHDEVEVVLLSL